MERVEIDKIIDRYFEGETSLQEEKRLRSYFSSGAVAPELEPYKAMFGFYESESKKSTSVEVEIPLEKNLSKKYAYKWTAIAAVLIILAGYGVFKVNNTSIEQNNGINHSLAVKQTQDLLYMMTDAISTGQEQMSYLKEFDKATNKILK